MMFEVRRSLLGPQGATKRQITLVFAQALSAGMGVKKKGSQPERGASRLPAPKTRTIPCVSLIGHEGVILNTTPQLQV
jgi:hypothetical protein